MDIFAYSVNKMEQKMDLPQILGKRIRYYRKQKHMSLRQLADIICKSVSTLSKYESGQIVLDITTLYDIAHAFHLPVEQLLYHEEIFMSPTEKDSYIPAFFHDVTRLYPVSYTHLTLPTIA